MARQGHSPWKRSLLTRTLAVLRARSAAPLGAHSQRPYLQAPSVYFAEWRSRLSFT